jgi:hypothetical protein
VLFLRLPWFTHVFLPILFHHGHLLTHTDLLLTTEKSIPLKETEIG